LRILSTLHYITEVSDASCASTSQVRASVVVLLVSALN